MDIPLYILIIAALSLLLNYLFLHFSLSLSDSILSDGQLRWGDRKKPAIGGITLYILFIASVSVVHALPANDSTIITNSYLAIVAASSVGFVLGLIDDAYNLNPFAKLFLQILCAIILIYGVGTIHCVDNFFFNYLVTITWVVGIMNSINMLDNMDATTSTVCMVIISFLIVISKLFPVNENVFLIITMLCVLGSVAGFLYFNWPPAKMYMGDTGSQFLGAFLASISLAYIWNIKDRSQVNDFQLRQFVIPMLVFCVPLIDTITVTFRRLLRGQSPFIGGRDHISHQLSDRGLSVRQIVFLFLVVEIVSCGIALVLLNQLTEWNWRFTFYPIAYFILLLASAQLIYDKKKHGAATVNGHNPVQNNE